MSSRAITSFRYTLQTLHTLRQSQRRWAQVHDIRFVAWRRNASSVQEKYKDKLEQKAQTEGHESIDSLKAAYKEKIADYRRAANTLDPARPRHTQPQPQLNHAPPPVPTGPSQTSIPATKTTTGTAHPQDSKKEDSGAPGIRPLSTYVDLPKLSERPVTEISRIWRLLFAADPKSLCAVIPFDTYQRIYNRARQHPQFILPLPRPSADDGSGDVAQKSDGFGQDEARTAADIHFLQWGFHPPSGPPPVPGSGSKNTHISTVLFTHLAAFKLHGAYAQPHTTVTHHLDLADSHGIVLLNGSVVDGRGVSADEARWLLMCLQKFYDLETHSAGPQKGERAIKRQSLLEMFTNGDTDGFKVEDLLDEAERVG